MAKEKSKTISSNRSHKSKIKQLDKKLEGLVKDFQKARNDRYCFPLLIGDAKITHSIVDDIFDDIKSNCKKFNGKIDVLIDSGGGDLDAAYNLANLLRKYAPSELHFFIPRWAKSAATLLVCSGDIIYMTPVAELGPLDPQITEFNPLEKRLEQFSPLHIEATLELIRQEFKKGSKELANGLMERLQFPLTLGSFSKSLDIAIQYLTKLLSTRMLSDEDPKKINDIAIKLTKGYSDHGFSINLDETKSIGLKAEEIEPDLLEIVWNIHKVNKEKMKIKIGMEQSRLNDLLKNVPPELLEKIPGSLRDQLNQ